MTKEKRKEIGKRLEKVRRKLGLTQVQISEKFNMPQGTYNKYENGINPLSWEFVQVFCKTFDIDDDWLYSGEGAMFKSKSESACDPSLLKAKDDEIEDLKKRVESLSGSLIDNLQRLTVLQEQALTNKKGGSHE